MKPHFCNAIFWRARLALFVLVAVIACAARGDETPLVYRRVLVPAESPATWPREGGKFLPVEARDFDAWVAAANRPAAVALVAEAEYAARLDEKEQLGGRGRWSVQLGGDRPARMPVGETSLVFRNAKWQGAEAEPARLGWSAANEGEPLEFALAVPRSGELEFDWHATATRSATGALEFPLRLPVAASRRLVLDLPANKQPVLEGSIVLESPAKMAEGGRWVLAVGATPTAVLRIEDIGRTEATEVQTTAVQEELHYDLSKRGIDLVARLQLTASGAPVGELNILLPAGLQLIAATAGERELKWHVAADAAGGSARAVVELPTGRSPRSVVLRAWGPLVTDVPQRLPKLSVENAFWTASTIELVVDPTLDLRELTPVDCAAIGLKSEQSGENGRGVPSSRRFAAFAPTATIELSIAHRQATGSVRMAGSLEVGNSGADGRLVAEVSVVRGSLHKLSAEVQPGWSIDAVETSPVDALGEWYVDRVGDRNRIELQLNRAVNPRQPVRIVVTGRLPREPTIEPLPLASLAMLKWNGLTVERNLLELRAAEQYELAVVGEIEPFDAGTLSANDRQLFAASVEGRLCDWATVTAGAAIRLTPKKGAYDAAIRIEAALVRGQLRQTFHIDCRPQGSGIDHVLVYLSEPPAVPLRWIEGRSYEPLVSERMPASDPRLGGLPPGGELWLLQLGRLYARPIEITAALSTAWTQRRRVPLISLPDAASQQGRVVVSNAGAATPMIVAQGMLPTPLPMDTRDETLVNGPAAACAIYRFQPTRFYDSGRAAELWLGPAAVESGERMLLATHVDVESHFAADGSGVHHIAYQLENLGAAGVDLRLPPGVQFESARVDGQSVASTVGSAITVPLSSHKRRSILELELSSRLPPLANGCRLAPPLPSGAITMLDGTWTVWLPHEFSAVDAASDSLGEELDWRGRLFGPFARPRTERVFNPFAAADWNSILSGLNRAVAAPAEAAPDRSTGAAPMPTGWHAIHVGFVTVPPSAITIVHPPTTAAWAIVVFLVCAVGATLGGVRTLVMLLGAGLAAAASLMLPVELAPLATGAVLGLVAAAVWQWLRRAIGMRKQLLVVVAAVAFIPSGMVHAAPQADSIQMVLVPVDAEGQVSGSKYFVREDFLGELVRSTVRPSASGEWLVTSMRCDGELVSPTGQAGPQLGNWSVTFEIDVLVRDAIVTLPLVKADADWSAAASLDGMPAPLTWDASGRGAAIHVAEPGHYRLAIPLEPHVEMAAGRQQVAINLPPVAGATIRIVGPAEIADLSCGDASIVRRVDQGRAVWQGEWSASGRLAVSWTSGRATARAVGVRRVDELMWLHVQPTGMLLDVKYVLPSGSEWPGTMDVAVDDEWELLGGGERDPAKQEVLPDGRQLLRVSLPKVTGDEREIRLRFRSKQDSPFGRFRVPHIGLVSLAVENRLLAVTSDDELEITLSVASPTATGSLAEFVATWGAGERAGPQFVWNAGKLDANWYLAVRPHAFAATHRDRLSLAAGKDRMLLAYESDVTPAGSNRAGGYGWSLDVPAELAIESVAAVAAGKPIPLDWARVAPSRLNIVFAEAIAGPYRLQLTGSLPTTKAGKLPLPRIAAAGEPASPLLAALYRTDDVLASWSLSGDGPAFENETGQAAPFGPAMHFVRGVAIDPAVADKVQILVKPNEPAVRGETLTTVALANGVWTATYSLQLQVEQGELGVLRLSVPPSFAGPFSNIPTASTELTPSENGQQPATLAIRLSQPVHTGDDLKLQIRSPLALADGQLPAIPQIALLAHGSWQQYFALPKTSESERATWTRVGIEPAELPHDLQADTFAPGAAETFRVVGEAMNVTLRPRQLAAPSASVQLVETAVHVDRGKGKFAVTRFILTPAGLDECVVRLPERERLVRAALDGRPALLRSLDPLRWQVQLGPPDLPQSLEIVTQSSGHDDAPSTQTEMSRPVLEVAGQPLRADLGLWTLEGTGQVGMSRVVGGSVTRPAELAATRLDRLASISQSATRSAIESPVLDGFNWFARWTAEIQDAELATKGLDQAIGAGAAIRVPQAADDLLANNVARCEAWIEQVAEVFAAAGMTLPARATGEVADFGPLRDATDEGYRLCFISDGVQDRLVVELVPARLSANETRFAAVASLVALSLVAYWLVRKPRAVEIVERWPQGVGIALGLAAWLWLRPSVLGLALAAVSVSLLLRRVARERKSPRHDSSKPTSSIPEELA